MRKLIQFIWPNFTRSSCSRVPSAEIQETSNNNDVIIPLYRRSLATISPSRSHITLSGICGLSLALLFTQTAHAEDLYAPDDWIINQDTHINAGDRMIVNADAQVTLAAGITLAIDSGAELIIKDGVNVNVDSGAKIEVYGSLLSQGLAGNETRFTSSLASPTHSSWQGIYANSGAKVNLSYTQISHAVTGIYANLTVINDDASDNDTQINVEHSRFINNSYGAFFYQLNNQIPLTANLQYNQFIGTQNHHLYAMGGSPMMATQIDARYNWWDSALAVTVASKIFDSRQSPLGLNVDYSDNYFSASMQSTQERSLAISLPTELLIDGEYGLFNDYYAVANLNISSGQILTLKAGNTLTIKAGVKLNLASGAQLIIEEGAKVELEDSANITVAAGATWQLNAGTQVLSALNVQLNIYGRLYAVGTQDNRVYFGSSFETPEKGRWFGIKAMSKSRIYLSYTQIKHANYGLWFYLNTYSTTSTSQAVLNVNHSYFNENVNGIRLEDAYGANYISASIQYNDFVDNDIHLYTQDKVTGGASVDARYNWWNTTDFTDIAAKIVDKKASTTGMLVDYSQYRLSNDIADIPQNLIYYHFPDALYEETKGYRLENNSIIEGNTSTKASQEIVLQAGHQLTIKAGKTLTIVAGSSFIIEDGAKLIVEDGAVINSAGTWSVADNAELSFGASSKIKVSAGSWAVAENAKLNFGHSANVTIAAGATWQLNAGTQVLSALNVQLNIVGTLKAQGTEDNLVYFGSSFETPEKGRWIGIVAFGKPNINLSYTQIKHANYGLWLYLNTNSTTSTSQAVLNVNHSYFNENVNGIRLEDAYGHNYISASIQYNDFVDNDIHLYTQDKVTGGASVDARYNWWSTTEFADIAAKIVDKKASTTGMPVDYSQYRLSNDIADIPQNLIYYHFPDALYEETKGYRLENNSIIEGNTSTKASQEIVLQAGHQLTIKAGKTLTIVAGSSFIIEDGAKLIVEDGAVINSAGTWSVADNAELSFGASSKIKVSAGSWAVAENAKLNFGHSANVTIAAGATWQLNAGTQVLSALNVQLNIVGTLKAQGTEDNLVYFGSSFETPEKGRWIGIVAFGKPNINLSYTQIKHANYGLWLYLNTNSTTSTSQAVLNVNHSYFNENVNGIRLEDAYGHNYISASIQYNDFVDNDIHLYTQDKVTGGASVDARYNWWSTTEFADIAAKIVDKKASTTGMPVDYSQYRLSNDIADIPQNLIYYHFPDALYEETKGYRLENNSIIEGNTSTKASQEIVLQAGHQLTIKAGKTLTIVAGSSFIIEDGAKLIVEDGAVINSAGTWSVADNAELSFGASSKIKVSAGSWAVAENAKLNFGHSANVTIAAGATWQLNAGTQVLSALNVQLNIVGTLKAQGTEDNLVYFGSSFETPEKGRWIGIVAFGKPNINLSYTQIKHANYGLWLYLNTNSTTSTSQAVLNVNHSYFNENVNGIRLEDAYGHNYISASIQYNDFVDNDIHLYTQDKVTGGASVDARYNWWSTTEFADIAAKIVDKKASTTGMPVDYSQYRLSNDIADIPQNLIYYHFPDALYEETKGYRLENNSIIEGNTSTKASQEIVLQAGHQLTIKAGKTLTIVAGSSFIIEDGAKLIVEDGAVINSAGTWSVADNAELSFGASSKIKVSAGSWAVAENAKLNFGHSANVTIAAGATWQLNAGTQVLSALNVQLNIVGTLKAQGTEDNLVYFGSSFETPEKGRWIGIVAFGKPNINLSYTQIKHANYGLWLYLNTNSTTSTSQAVLNVNHSYFNENVNGIRLEDAYGHNYISASIQYNDFVDNDIHLYTQDKVTGGASVDARYNWWNTSDFADIATKIVDKQASTTGMPVDYSQYRLSSDIADIGLNLIHYYFPDILIQASGEQEDQHILDGQFTLVGDTSITSGQIVRVKAGSNLTIKAGKTLTVALGAQLIIEDGVHIVLEAGAKVVVLGTWDVGENASINVAYGATVNVAASGIWNIAAGTQVHIADDVWLHIYGQLISTGRTDNFITFGSSQAVLEKNNWEGIKAYSGSKVTLTYTQVSHTASGLYVYLYNSNGLVADINVSYSRFSENVTGITLEDAYSYQKTTRFAPSIIYSDFIDNDINLKTIDSNRYRNTTVDARYNWWGATTLEDISAKLVYSENNAQGMQVNLSPYRLSREFNDYFDALIDFEWPESRLIDGEYVLDANYLISSDINIAEGEIVRIKAGRHVRLAAGMTLTIAVGGKLILEDGGKLSLSDDVQVKVYGDWELEAGARVLSGLNGHIQVYGSLIGNGALDNEILFASSLTAPTLGSWQGITAYGTATVQLKYTQIRHALYGVYAHINNSANNQVIDIQYSRFVANTNGVRFYEGYDNNGLAAVISYNQFIDNTVNVYATHNGSHTSTTVIDARFNWWNSSDISDIMAKIYDHMDTRYGMNINYGQYRGSTAIDDILDNVIAWSWPDSLIIDGETVLNGDYNIVGNTEIAANQVVRVKAGSHITLASGVDLTVKLGGQFIIEEGASVTIEDGGSVEVYGEWIIAAGVHIKSGANVDINVYGRLIGNGIEDHEIYFRSSLADSSINSWNGITAYANANVSLRYTQISHALYGIYAYIDNSSNAQVIDIQYSRFVGNTHGVRILEGYENTGLAPVLQYNQFIDNNLHLYATHNGSHTSTTVIDARYNWWNSIDISEITSKIYDYQDATYGMFINYGQFRGSSAIDDIIDNAIAWIWPESLIVDGETLLDGDYTFIGNTHIVADQVVRVKAGSHINIGAGVKLTIALGGQFIIEEGGSVTIEDGGSVDVYGEWIIGAGVTVTSGLNARINVYGSLIGNGLEGSEIHFGSSVEAPSAGSWYGIHAHANAKVTLRYTQILHAQYGVYVDINHSINSQIIDIKYSRFIENTYGIYVYEGYSNTGSSLVLHYNQFMSNDFHIHGSHSNNHSSTTVIDARFNWWNSTRVGEILAKIYDHQDASDGLMINYGQYRGSIDIDDIIDNAIAWIWPDELIIDNETVLDGDFTFIGNTHITTDQVVRVTAGSHITIGAGVTLTVAQAGRWIIEDGARITIEDAAIINVYGEWRIGAGVNIRSGLNVKLNIYGSLIGNGIEGNEIHFGSSLDVPHLGSWQGITAYSGANIQLVYTQVSHAEYGLYAHINSDMAINVDIRYSRFVNNTNAVRVYETIQNTGSTFIVQYNQFINNTFNIYAYSVDQNSTLHIDASFNWWNTVVAEDIAAKIFDHAYGLTVDHDHDRFGAGVDDIGYVYDTGTIDTDVIVERRIRIIGETRIDASHSVTIGAGSSITIDADSTLHVDGDLIVEEGAEFIVDEDATVEVTGRIIVTASELTLPADLTVNLTAGSRFYTSIDTQVDVRGHFNSQGSEDNLVYIGLREEDRDGGLWQGLAAHAGSHVVIKHTHLSHAEVGIYAGDSSDVNITHSWLMNNTRAIHLYYNEQVSLASFAAHYNRFEGNTEYNIYAEQTETGYFNDRVSVEYNWWGSVDIALINHLFFDRGDDANLGLWLDFSYIWLDNLGENIWHNGVAGSIDTVTSYSEDISIIGYTEINADISINADASLIVEPNATLIANANVTIAELAKVVVGNNSVFKVNQDVSLTLNPETDLQLGVGAKVEIIGELIARAAMGQSIIFRGAEVQDPKVCPLTE